MKAVRLGVHLCALAAIAGLVSCASKGDKEEPPKRTILATEYDDIDLGERASHDLAAQMGHYENPELSAYVAQVGGKMVRHAPRRPFRYRFHIVDEAMPNAFALPGGYIYVSRGLLALASSEDELAGVLGHEITHSAERHAAGQQEMARRGNPFQMPILRKGKLAAYGRKQENDADRGGQQLAAAAGYDPAALSTFLHRLDTVDRLRFVSTMPNYFSTHPATVERVSTTRQRAAQLSMGPRDPVEPDEEGYLRRVEGVVIGNNPAGGLFRGSLFLHPDLQFEMRFPAGWSTHNDHQNVGAVAPDGDALVFLSVEGKAGDSRAFAEKFVEHHRDEHSIEVLRSSHIVVAGIDAWRLAVQGRLAGRSVDAQFTFVPYRGLMYRITAIAPHRVASHYVAQARNAVRSFRPLTEEPPGGYEVLRLRIVKAHTNESIPALMERTHSGLTTNGIAVLNGIFADHRFSGGELVKVAARERYTPKVADLPEDEPLESSASEAGRPSA